MKKILITLFCVLIFISCCNERREITYIVKFKDGSQMEVVGHYSTISKHSAYVMSYDGSYNFNRDEILYIIKK
jgi:thioredoxin-related protein